MAEPISDQSEIYPLKNQGKKKEALLTLDNLSISYPVFGGIFQRQIGEVKPFKM